ncbi:pantoate--beta-alanine ligase [Tenacibaculum sp. SG-28]|uniref:pantoate--beta-alanine ligase n=1 Tax=Tenacibaculum sp. SG-28 TaxID=754426 RepID=UPI000CF4E0CE|nr:pantoate--beta-alanine ligase [Tenacibaculum sp. SG-28]PQJ21702.1 pantoate--beta-alanine ligase [Tenacibaculum sp. SG-28]
MDIFKTKTALRATLTKYKKEHKTIGFVPTMGALHDGHLSLVRKSKEENDITVVSIFVNPTQFDNKKDLEKYPKTFNKDCNLLESVGCDILYYPTTQDIYEGELAAEKFSFNGLEFQMEGKHREGHFDGVGTIVKKLFKITEPNKAYFGRKRFQQLQIVKQLVNQEKIPVTIKGQPILREKDGLAMSSRNARLTREHREIAPLIYKTLQEVQQRFPYETIQNLNQWVQEVFEKEPLLQLEYFCIADTSNLQTVQKKELHQKYRAFIAVFAGDIRLIDNISLQ